MTDGRWQTAFLRRFCHPPSAIRHLMLRITAGTLRGRRIPVPKNDVRPTSERARQAFFNIAGARIQDARFLDLFAGSGIFSFEAISRGASESVAIDKSRAHMAAIDRAAKELDVRVRTLTADVLAGIKRLGTEVFDVVYADPPYAYPHYDDLLMSIDALPLADDAIVAIEHRRHSEPFTVTTNRLNFSRRAEYGEVWISFFMT
ncbi:MAG: 16S rRNA (guanine(966)-N(2))-methyltransferase RsmD [Acidobacteria bacterium]|nr:MAG: 16S rRNA (guanine(966)-N(2))-methyltransferase RsmD [Acidobacteriota bacterium]